MMLIFVSTLVVFITSVKNGHGIPTPTVKYEKPLFIPNQLPDSFIISNQGQPTVYGQKVESAPFFQNAAFSVSYDYQNPVYMPLERVLHMLNHPDEKKNRAQNANNLADEDDYKRNSNNVLSSEQLTPELEDLDRKYKRSTTYGAAWNSPTVKNLEATYRAPTFNSRAVNGRPFGPYSTWSALTTSSNAGGRANVQNRNNPARRRRHDSEGNDDIGGVGVEMLDDTPSPLQYAPAYNRYTQLPAHLVPLHTRFVRDMPLQYSVVYEPSYPVGRTTSENLALLTNSLLTNAAPSAHGDELEKFA